MMTKVRGERRRLLAIADILRASRSVPKFVGASNAHGSWAPLIIIGSGNFALQTSSTTSTSLITTVSGAVLLILAWLVCAVLTGVGIATKRGRVLSLGVVAAGIMTIVTPLAYYTSETLRLGVFEASVQDFLLLAALSTLGGGIITFGILRLPKRELCK
jgi:hypothetical protein